MKIAGCFSSSRLALGIGALLFGISAAQAHHPIQAKFDPAKKQTLTGIVTEVDWRNPHAHVFMNVTNGSTTLNWAVELESPVILKNSGWSGTTLQPGDTIQVSGITARDGSRQIWGENVVSSANNRQVYNVTNAAPTHPLAPRPTPRWPDGHVALGTTTGGTDGFWAFPSAKVLQEDGANLKFDSDAKLLNINDANKVAPMQPWALALYKHRQERNLQDDPMYLNCKPPGGPRQYQSDLGLQLLEDRENGRIFVLMGSGNRNYRIIYLDGRTTTGLVSGDDDNPLYYGRALGRWEGDTLVVTTSGFNEDFWFSNGGLPHTDLLTMEERFTRPDADTLQYKVTINDPGAYTKPWSASWTMQWVGGEDLPPYFCQSNRQ
ncbi:MAG: hypothetical protein LBF16_09665 [Pseudomonadales bacterium]|jgi:hypothetical protein|nr:hypothetical protein [Pseudomonadales bacterium]